MTTNELRELDAWIAEHVMELPPAFVVIKRGLYYRPDDKGYTIKMSEAGRYTLEQAKERECPYDEPVTYKPWECEHYTTDPAAAMEVLKKCGDFIKGKDHPRGSGNYYIRLYRPSMFNEWCVCRGNEDQSNTPYGQAETLELAICQFAKKLFSK